MISFPIFYKVSLKLPVINVPWEPHSLRSCTTDAVLSASSFLLGAAQGTTTNCQSDPTLPALTWYVVWLLYFTNLWIYLFWESDRRGKGRQREGRRALPPYGPLLKCSEMPGAGSRPKPGPRNSVQVSHIRVRNTVTRAMTAASESVLQDAGVRIQRKLLNPDTTIWDTATLTNVLTINQISWY